MKIDKNFISEIKLIIAKSREKAIQTVDNIRVVMYWQIGKRIFEEEQQGKDRAAYGTYLTKTLAAELQPEYGSGFTARQIERYRQFYRTFPIASALRTQFSWTHYKLLLPLDNAEKREYYILEAVTNNWNSRQLERQINSQLYERLLLSNDKNDSMVKITLPENNKTILASKYQLYLPSEQILLKEMKEELEKLNTTQNKK